MSDTKRNEALATQMGWTPMDELNEYGHQLWIPPGKTDIFCEAIPDFCGSNCEAVKWLLPFLWEEVGPVNLFTGKDSCGLEIPKLFREKKQSGFHGASISLVLAAAMKALKGGDMP